MFLWYDLIAYPNTFLIKDSQFLFIYFFFFRILHRLLPCFFFFFPVSEDMMLVPAVEWTNVEPLAGMFTTSAVYVNPCARDQSNGGPTLALPGGRRIRRDSLTPTNKRGIDLFFGLSIKWISIFRKCKNKTLAWFKGSEKGFIGQNEDAPALLNVWIKPTHCRFLSGDIPGPHTPDFYHFVHRAWRPLVRRGHIL